MPDVPYPITAENSEDLKRQVWELIREIFEERIGGLNMGDIFEDSGGVLTLRLGTSNPCLQKVANALQLEVRAAGGLQATSTGVAAKLKTAGGIDVDSEGLFVSSSAYGFGTINCPSGNDPVADATNDTLNLIEGSGITITGDSSADSVTIASTVTRATLGLDTTDSPVFATVKLSGLNDGYIPYHVSDDAGLDDSPIFTDGTNITVSGNITLPDLGWVGLGAAKGRIVFDDATTDTIVFSNCNIGIGGAPSEDFHQRSGGNFAVTGTFASGDDLTISGVGSKMFFHTKKGAFRAGYITNVTPYKTYWNEVNIGPGSIGLGKDVKASGNYGVAIGNESATNGEGVVIGVACNILPTSGVAIGSGLSSNSGNSNVLIGFQLGVDAPIIGYNVLVGTTNSSTGEYAMILGHNNLLSAPVGGTVYGTSIIGSAITTSLDGYVLIGSNAGAEEGFNGTVYVADTGLISGGAVGIGRVPVTGEKLGVAGNVVVDGTITSRFPVVVKTDTYTATIADTTIVCNKASAMTINLPAATGSGHILHIKNINTGVVTIDGNSAETIDGETTQTIYQWDSISVQDYVSGKWIII